MAIKLYGRYLCKKSYELRDFLQRSTVEFEWHELVTPADFKGLNVPFNVTDENLPVCIFPNGECLIKPSLLEVASRLGLISKPKFKEYDVAIYGAGPAGLSAAVYAASEGLKTILVERSSIGGQAGSSSLIENFLGYPDGVSGAEIAEKSRQQAVKFGVEILLLREGIKAEFHDNRIYVDLDDGEKLVSRANICATGVQYIRLGLPKEDDFLGQGLYYGAGLSEAQFCVDEEVYIVGGGNSAGQAAAHLSKFAKKVVLLVRGPSLSDTMSKYLVEKLQATAHLEVRLNTRVVELDGDRRLERIQVEESGKPEWIKAKHLFVAIGGRPNTDWAKATPLICDTAGYLVTGPDLLKFDGAQKNSGWPLKREPYYLETNMPGFFAVGDVRHGSIKRMATAVGEGAMSITFVHRYLTEAPQTVGLV